MTLAQLDELGGALQQLRTALAFFESACTLDEQGNVDDRLIKHYAHLLEEAHWAWNRAFEAGGPLLPAPSRPRGWVNLTTAEGCV